MSATRENPASMKTVTTADIERESGPRSITLRAILIGLLLIPCNSYWIVMVEYVYCTLHPTLISLFATSIFTLVLLILANAVMRRTSPKLALTQAEMITVYSMLNIGTAVVSHHCLQVLVSSIAYPASFANSSNGWEALFVRSLPDWLVVKDPVALKAYYAGGDLLNPAVFMPWITPIICWSGFALTIFGMFLCINVLLRKQWTEREKLAYPLVQLPLDMTAPGTPLFRNRLFWFGIAIVTIIDVVNGLSGLYPAIPQIPVKYTYALTQPTNHPWTAIGWLPMLFYPFGIGLGMLLPVDMLFSCWFFFWVWKAEAVIAAAFGFDSIPGMPFVQQQSFGAYMGIAVFSLALARRHIANLARAFFGGKAEFDDSGEAISYRTAIWGLIIGSLILVAFSALAGMPVWLAILFFVLYFAISIAITRMRAEMGLPAHDLEHSGPDAMIPGLLGAKHFDTRSLSALSLYQWFNRGYESNMSPIQLESMKMASVVRADQRRLVMAMGVATTLGLAVGFLILLHTIYSRGGATANFAPPICPTHLGHEAWDRMDTWTRSPSQSTFYQSVAAVAGFCVVLLLDSLRLKLSWFPFHPVGYAVSSSWSMHVLWGCMFVAWLIKLVLLRYGGMKLYRSVLPLFMGFIIGECVVGGLWTIIGIVFSVPSYRFFP